MNQPKCGVRRPRRTGFTESRFAALSPLSGRHDGDSLSYFWFHYREAGSLEETISAGAENSAAVWVVAPKVDRPETAHFILKVTDKGSPPLSRYERVIVTITP